MSLFSSDAQLVIILIKSHCHAMANKRGSVSSELIRLFSNAIITRIQALLHGIIPHPYPSTISGCVLLVDFETRDKGDNWVRI